MFSNIAQSPIILQEIIIVIVIKTSIANVCVQDENNPFSESYMQREQQEKMQQMQLMHRQPRPHSLPVQSPGMPMPMQSPSTMQTGQRMPCKSHALSLLLFCYSKVSF